MIRFAIALCNAYHNAKGSIKETIAVGVRRVTVCHMKRISIRQLYLLMRAWVRGSAALGSITVTEQGRPVARPGGVAEPGRENRFLTRRLRPGYKRLRGTLTGGTDSVTIVSEDRDGR